MERPDHDTLRPLPEGYQITLAEDRSLTGGDITRELSPHAIYTTAMDMVSAAALAEVETAAVRVLCGKRRRTVYDPDEVVEKYLHHLRACYTLRRLGSALTVRLYPHVDLPHATPVIDLYLGRYEPVPLAPGRLRAMAADWLRVAAGVPQPPSEEENNPEGALREHRRRQDRRYWPFGYPFLNPPGAERKAVQGNDQSRWEEGREVRMVMPSTDQVKAPRILAFDPEALYARLDTSRRSQRLSWRALSRQSGIDTALISRLGHGHSPGVGNLVRVLAWLGETDLAPYLREVR